MKKITLLIIGLVLFNQVLISQNNNPKTIPNGIDITKIIKNKNNSKNDKLLSNDVCSRISPLSEKLLLDIKKTDEFQSIKAKKEYVLKSINDNSFVSGLIRVNDNNDIENLEKIGVKFSTKAGNILTFRVNLNDFENLVNTNYYNYLQIDEPVRKKLDLVLPEIKADKVHLGVDLPQAYSGEGVVIGILDGGFDYTNPNFLDITKTQSRISRVWEQNYTNGTPPANYDYGGELKNSAEILNKKTDDTYASHGTHVAGIASGNGYLTDGKYIGVAPSADLVFVSLAYDDFNNYQTGQSSIIDGIAYVFKYAESVGKPAVINMSLGTHIGPHDGTSLFDQACDALVGPGKILVGSAGNEGEMPLHISKQLSTSSNFFSTFVELEYLGSQYPAQGMIDIWGENGEEFCIFLSLADPASGEIENTEELCTSINNNVQKKLTGSDGEMTISMFASASEFNSKPRIFLYLENSSEDLIILTVSSDDAKVNLWNHGLGSGLPFSSYGIKEFTNGDNSITVGEIGGTGKNIITVGAYSTRNSYQSIEGETFNSGYPLNKLTDYSSRGPTVDGRVKPEITAPGSVVISSANSYDLLMSPNGPYRDEVVTEVTVDGTQSYPFAAFEGTSMSSPAVAGVVALMLQYFPSLTPKQVKSALKASAITDSHTGTIPPNGSNDWGWGKINAHEAVKLVPTDVKEYNIESKINIFPNPSSGVFSANFSDEQLFNLIISDVLGNEIIRISDYQSGDYINLENYSQNVFFVKLINKNIVYYEKVIINK